jgi:LacI family transcriptional regulator
MAGERPTIIDIAKLTGISYATVSRALDPNSSAKVAPATRNRVLEVAREVGYRPNYAGRALVAGKTNIISYLTADGFSPYYSMVARQVTLQAERRGYSVVLDCTYDPAHGRTLTTVQRRPEIFYSGVDGIIACDIARPQNDYAAEVRQMNVPMVGMGMGYLSDVDRVGFDLAGATRELLQHLFDQGCRKIAHLTDPTAVANEQRALTYKEMMAQFGLQERWITVPSHRRWIARKGLVDYLADNELPDAIFCINDESAIGCYRGLSDLGIRVPEDVLIAGCDGIEDTDYHFCPITTLVMPVEEMCSIAWDMLERRIGGSKEPLEHVVLPVKLAIKQSTLRK